MAANPQRIPEGHLAQKPRVHSRSHYLTKDELEELRSACARAARTPEFGPRRQPGPWDFADGKKIACLLCGVQLGNLGTHLVSEHAELLRVFDGNVAVAYKDYTYSQGWGRAPINSLNAREGGRRRTAEYKERQAQKPSHTATNVVEIANSTQWYRDQIRDPRRADVLRRQRLAKEQAKLTAAEKETLIACRLCEEDGNPEYRFKTVRIHTKTIHGIPFKKYKRMFPDASTATKIAQQNFDRVANALSGDARTKLAKAEAEIRRLLAEAKTPSTQVQQLRKLSLMESVQQKLADPNIQMWMSPNEVAFILGISPATFYRKVKDYRHLRKNPTTGWYATDSVIEQKRRL